MVSILLAYSEDTKEKALRAGFKETTVLIKHGDGLSGREEKDKKAELEYECSGLHPFQWLVSNLWGAMPD